MRRTSPRAWIAPLVLWSPVCAQLAWVDRQPSASPPARRQAAMTFEPYSVLFGGSGASGLLQDTWEWNGSTWTQRFPTQSLPPARQEHAMAHLPGFGAVVLFGGFTGTSVGFLQDTWIWTGQFWSPRTTLPSPPARKGHTLTYDPKSKLVILFGGNDNIGPRSDTWAWTGNQWLQLQTPNSPPPRGGHAAAYDENLGRVVIFGGFGMAPLADTWAFDGTTWAQLAPAASPSPRAYHAMVWDSLRRRTVLRGPIVSVPGEPSLAGPAQARPWPRGPVGCAARAAVPRQEARLPAVRALCVHPERHADHAPPGPVPVSAAVPER